MNSPVLHLVRESDREIRGPIPVERDQITNRNTTPIRGTGDQLFPTGELHDRIKNRLPGQVPRSADSNSQIGSREVNNPGFPLA